MLISLLEVCQEGGYLEDFGGFLTIDMMDRVIPNVMNNVFYPKEDTLKISCPYIYWKGVRKGGVKKGGTWRTLGVPDGRLGGQGRSRHHE